MVDANPEKESAQLVEPNSADILILCPMQAWLKTAHSGPIETLARSVT